MSSDATREGSEQGDDRDFYPELDLDPDDDAATVAESDEEPEAETPGGTRGEEAPAQAPHPHHVPSAGAEGLANGSGNDAAGSLGADEDERFDAG